MNLILIKRIFLITLTIWGVLLPSSCVPRRDVVYFENINQVQDQLISNIDNNIRIKPDDRITIMVFGPERRATEAFNLSLGNSGGGGGGNNAVVAYTVFEDGTIDFPVLGSIEVEKLTSLELAKKIKERLGEYIEDPVVIVEIINFQITLLGEVAQTIRVQDDHISLPQALGLAGDIPLTGKRKKILVMREENGGITHAYLDITDAKIVNSPFYHLKQNDVVYVEPNVPKRQGAGYLGTIGTYLGLFSAVLSVILFII